MTEQKSIEFVEHPTICSPYVEPPWHHARDEKGRPTDRIVRGRAKSSYSIPSSSEKKGSPQTGLWQKTSQEHYEVNRTRNIVRKWREENYPHVTKMTRSLLDFWRSDKRKHPLFFCQIEALETAIYLNEIDEKIIDSRVRADLRLMPTLRGFSSEYNESLLRIAFKMATGTGKTLVMAMMIAYHFLNRTESPNDKRFAKKFLVVSPGLTIKDRLQVLKPQAKNNYYQEHDLVPSSRMGTISHALVEIVNFHALKKKERGEGSARERRAAGQGQTGASLESDIDMVNRVCKGKGGDILVLNDEAHHCYRRRESAEDERKPRKGDEEEEAAETKRRHEQARLWISGLEAIERVRGVKMVYDLSATPSFLKGSGEPEGKLFPWVVSDFSLTEAIESGIVKIPKVPVADNRPGQTKDQGYQNLWRLVGDKLPRKGYRSDKIVSDAGLFADCPDLQRALAFLYGEYEKRYNAWQGSDVPPVLIVVCQNTNISRRVRDWIAGFTDDKGFVREGKLSLFRNEKDSAFLSSPRTILVDSEEMEAAEGLSKEFKDEAREQISHHKNMRAEKIKPEEILRRTMNSVGKVGELGGQVRCVVSVSMLTEGWDTNTVTHVLGVRAFGTQLLCEQVVGRALRRTGYDEKITKQVQLDSGEIEEIETFAPEYADIYGIPFHMFFPTQGGTGKPPQPFKATHVRALRSRKEMEIRFPRVSGYCRTFPPSVLCAKFTEDSRLSLTTETLPTKLMIQDAMESGSPQEVGLPYFESKREAEAAFQIAHRILNYYFQGDRGRVFGDGVEGWRFENLLEIVNRWMNECVDVGDDCFKQLLLAESYTTQAREKIGNSLVVEELGEGEIVPILPPYDKEGSTRYVQFTTTKKHVYETERSHISHVVADTEVWEQALAAKLEGMEEVLCYAKNERLGFTIPYEHAGTEHDYYPDFIVHIDDGGGAEDPLKLILEVKGREREDSRAKAQTTQNLWLPAVNRSGEFGRWSFLELRDVNSMKNEIRKHLQERKERDYGTEK